MLKNVTQSIEHLSKAKKLLSPKSQVFKPGKPKQQNYFSKNQNLKLSLELEEENHSQLKSKIADINEKVLSKYSNLVNIFSKDLNLKMVFQNYLEEQRELQLQIQLNFKAPEKSKYSLESLLNAFVKMQEQFYSLILEKCKQEKL